MLPLLVFLMSLKDLGNPTINSFDQEITLEASLSGLPNESYFRVEWQKSSGDTYFGYNKVGDSWVVVNANEDCKNYIYINDTKTTLLSISTKVGDTKNFVNGSNNLKLRRYTATCASYSDSDPITVNLNLMTSTPTTTHSPTTVPTPAQTKIPIPTSTISPSPVSIQNAVPTPQKFIATEPDFPGESANVLGIENVADSTPTIPEPTIALVSQGKTSITGPVLIGLGVVIIASSIFFAMKTSKPREPPNDI